MNKKLKWSSVQSQLIIALGIALVVPSVLLGYMTYQQTEFVNLSAVIGTKEELSDLSGKYSDIFAKTEQLLTDMAKQKELQFEEYNFPATNAVFNKMPAPNNPAHYQFYSAFFRERLHHDDYILNSFYATKDGAFYPIPAPPESVDLREYDPRERDWYLKALSSDGQFIWTEPYIDFGSKQSTITFAQAVKSPEGEIIGVIGIDFNLNQLALEAREGIFTNTVWIIALSILVGAVGAYLFIRSFTRKIKQLQLGIKALEQGDFTQQLQIKGKDELADLGDRYNKMTASLGALIRQVVSVTQNVNQTSRSLSEQTVEYSNQSGEMSRAVEEIAVGASTQAEAAENNHQHVGYLVELLNGLKDDTSETVQLSSRMEQASRNGYSRLDRLEQMMLEGTVKNEHTAATIEQLKEKSDNITSVTRIIRELANQTNLLSLNAAIEAARAGEHGAGFAVVANEVRKLADQSAQSAILISDTIGEISEGIDRAIASIQEVTAYVAEQNDSLANTKASFLEISSAVGSTSERIQGIYKGIEEIDKVKDTMLAAIADISAVSEQTAAGSEEVSASVTAQLETIQYLSAMAQRLDETAKELYKETEKFKL